MGLGYGYGNRINQNRTAKWFSMSVENKVLENGNIDPDGEKYIYSKIGRNFRCGVWGRNIRMGGKQYIRQNLSENLNVENSSLTLYSSDHQVLNKIKQGDKVIYEGEEYMVEKVSYPKAFANSEYQRIEENTLVAISLT